MQRPPRGSLEPPAEARRQAGVFTAAQAARHGYSPRQIRRRLADGQWSVVAGRGLTADRPTGSGNGGPAGWPASSLAWAAHLTWPDAVIGYRVAGALHGFPVSPGANVHVILGRSARPFGGLVPHRVPVRPGDLARLGDGLPITSRLCTAVDCLADLEEDAAWELLAWLDSRDKLARAHLTAHLTRRTGRPGTAQLRRLHAATSTGAASLPERRLHQLLAGLGLTGWAAGVRVCDDEGIIGRVDVLFADAKLVIEVDGYAAHSPRDAFEHDRRRQNRLVNASYRVLRFTWNDLYRDPDGVRRRVLAALAAH